MLLQVGHPMLIITFFSFLAVFAELIWLSASDGHGKNKAAHFSAHFFTAEYSCTAREESKRCGYHVGPSLTIDEGRKGGLQGHEVSILYIPIAFRIFNQCSGVMSF
jgi:hypothetical protein